MMQLLPVRWEERHAFEAQAVPYLTALVPDLPAPKPGHFDHFWNNPGRYAFWLGTKRAGFALVRAVNARQHELCEFCILPANRRQGLGQAAAHATLLTFPGPWRIGVAAGSAQAAPFWHNVLNRLAQVSGLIKTPPQTAHQSHSYTFEISKDPV